MPETDADKAFPPTQQAQAANTIAPPRAFNGATSFQEADAHQSSMKREEQFTQLAKAMQGIVTNVLMSDQMSFPDKAKRLIEIGREALARVGSQGADGEGNDSANSTSQAEGDKPTATKASFNLMRTKDGPMRFIASHTNMFQDREGEILTRDAHRRFIALADARKSYPELRLWHVKGTKFGQVDMLDEHDGFVIASGTIDAGKEDIAERVAADSDLGMSHGFTYEPEDFVNGVYNDYKSYEISVLPRERAANVITAWAKAKEAEMDATKKGWLAQKLGSDKAVSDLETLLSSAAKAAHENNVSFKDIVEEMAADAEAPFKPAEPAGDLKVVLDAIGKMTEAIVGQDKAIKELQGSKVDTDALIDAAVARAIGAKDTRGFSASKDGDDASSTPDGKKAAEAVKETINGSIPKYLEGAMNSLKAITG